MPLTLNLIISYVIFWVNVKFFYKLKVFMLENILDVRIVVLFLNSFWTYLKNLVYTVYLYLQNYI